MDIGKHKRSLYQGFIDNHPEIETGKIHEIQQRYFLLEFPFAFQNKDSKEKELDLLYDLIQRFKQNGK